MRRILICEGGSVTSIVLGRVDYRLLHGIVATMQAPQSGAQRVVVIDDHTANDPIVKESMRLGKPAGMARSIITEETAMKNFKTGKYDDHKVFVVCEGPGVFLKLRGAGQRIPRIVIGITCDRGSETKISSRVSMKDKEKPIYKGLMENGCEVDVQFTTTGRAVKLSHATEL